MKPKKTIPAPSSSVPATSEAPGTPIDEHARLSPSTFKQREICPLYKNDGVATKAADRGSALHKLLEVHGCKAASHDDAELLDEADFNQLCMICDYTSDLENQPGVKVIREHRFDLTSLNIPECDKGTADLLVLNKKLKHVDLADYKFGFIEVDDAEYNIQIWIYVLGAFTLCPWAESVTAHILQPARNEISLHTFIRDDIARMLLRAKTIAERALDPNSQPNPVYENCGYCANKSSCTAMHNFALRALHYAQLQFPAVEDLSPESFNDRENSGIVYDIADLLGWWVKQIKYTITQMAMEGEVPDHEVMSKNGKREIIDPIGALEIAERFGISREEFLAISTPSISGLEKLASASAPRGEKGRRAKELSDALSSEGIVVSTQPYSYLVRIKTKAE